MKTKAKEHKEASFLSSHRIP